MKIKKYLLTLVIAIFITSCMPPSYIQVYKAIPSGKYLLKDMQIMFEDDNCKVIYNLWDEGGNIGFRFYNKTDQSIYLKLDKSFFILNGISYSYYQNRVFTYFNGTEVSSSKSSISSKSVSGLNFFDLLQTNRYSASNTTGVMNSSGYTVSYNEEKEICIPALTAKIINEFKISSIPIRHCDLQRFPTKTEINIAVFSKVNSPLVFSNRICYTIGKADIDVLFENEFYISEVVNYPENMIIDQKHELYCGKKGDELMEYFTINSPDKFYVKYNFNQGNWIKLE